MQTVWQSLQRDEGCLLSATPPRRLNITVNVWDSLQVILRTLSCTVLFSERFSCRSEEDHSCELWKASFLSLEGNDRVAVTLCGTLSVEDIIFYSNKKLCSLMPHEWRPLTDASVIFLNLNATFTKIMKKTNRFTSAMTLFSGTMHQNLVKIWNCDRDKENFMWNQSLMSWILQVFIELNLPWSQWKLHFPELYLFWVRNSPLLITCDFVVERLCHCYAPRVDQIQLHLGYLSCRVFMMGAELL